MAEQNNANTRNIEDVMNETLSGDAQKNALELVVYIKADESGKTQIINHEGGEMWLVKKKDKILDLIYVDGTDECPGPWTMWIRGDYIGEYSDYPVDEKIKEAAWAHVAPCKPCSSDCNRGSLRTVFGKEFAKACPDTIMFTNPDAQTIEYIKKIIDIRNNDIKNPNARTYDYMDKLC